MGPVSSTSAVWKLRNLRVLVAVAKAVGSYMITKHRVLSSRVSTLHIMS